MTLDNMSSKFAVVLFGPPGSGKGTVKAELTRFLSAISFSTGEYLNELYRTGRMTPWQEAEFKKGAMFPNEMMNELITEFVQSANSNLVFDGYPRTIEQAVDFDHVLRTSGVELKAVIHLSAPREVLLDRITKRRICSNCQYPVLPEDTVCLECSNTAFETRPTDAETVANKRLNDFDNFFSPIEEYYGYKILRIENHDLTRDTLINLVCSIIAI